MVGAICFYSSIVLGLLGSDVSLENGELTERWWHKAADPRRIAELPRLKMNSVSDLRVCGYCVLLICPSRDRGRLFLTKEGKAWKERVGAIIELIYD